MSMFGPGTGLCSLRAARHCKGCRRTTMSLEQRAGINNPTPWREREGKEKGKGRGHWELLSSLACHNCNPAPALSRVAEPPDSISHTCSSKTESILSSEPEEQSVYGKDCIWAQHKTEFIFQQSIWGINNMMNKLFPSFVLFIVTA